MFHARAVLSSRPKTGMAEVSRTSAGVACYNMTLTAMFYVLCSVLCSVLQHAFYGANALSVALTFEEQVSVNRMLSNDQLFHCLQITNRLRAFKLHVVLLS